MTERMIIRVLSVIAVLQAGLLFGTTVGIVATSLGAALAVAAVAAATIAVASTGVGLTITTILLSGSVKDHRRKDR